MLERFAHFLLKKKSHAAGIAFLCSVLPILFASVSAIIVALVTLRKGSREGLFVLAWAILPFLARAYVAESYLLFATSIVTFIVIWGMAVILRQYPSWSMLLNICAFISVAVVLGAHLFSGDIVLWWKNHLNNYIQTLEKQSALQVSNLLPPAAVLWIAKLATGIEVFCLFFAAGIKLVMARWWQGVAFKSHCLHKELLQTRLSCWVLGLSVLLLAVGLFVNKQLIDALLPVVGFYIIAGLCLLHYWLQGYKYAKFALFGFYIVILIFPYVLGLIVLLGLLDSIFKLREVHRGSDFIRKNS